MFHLLIFIALTSINSYAFETEFASCQQKIIDSKSIVNNKISILVKNNQRLIYSKTTPQIKIIKHDPFLNLYLVEDNESFMYPFIINMKQNLDTALINKKLIYKSKIIEEQIGLNQFAKIDKNIKVPTIVTTSCCSLEGIVTPAGIIEKKYLNRFINSKKSDYSDIGIRVNSLMHITSVNPFIDDNPFIKGDLIIALNNKVLKSASTFMQRVLFSDIGTIHNVKVKRANKTLNFNIKSHKRYGGGFISDTFLEEKGIYFNEQLKITKIEAFYNANGIKVGDKLLKVNGTKVNNEKDLRKYIADFKDFSFLLLERDNFQFFVKIN